MLYIELLRIGVSCAPVKDQQMGSNWKPVSCGPPRTIRVDIGIIYDRMSVQNTRVLFAQLLMI